MIKLSILTTIFSILCGLSAYYFNASYTTNEDYFIRFSTKKAEGTFNGLKGLVSFSENDLESSFMNVTVDVSTIQTGNKTKDKHAKKSKWFHAEKYPQISFISDEIIKIGKKFQVTGSITIRDVTQKHSIEFSTQILNDKTYLIGFTTINRTQFNIDGNLFAFAVGKNVDIELKIPAIYQVEK